MRAKRGDYTLWQKHFQDFPTSKMSVSDYCKEHQLPLSQWYKIRRRLGIKNNKSTKIPKFAQAIIDEKLPPITLDLNSGIKITFERSVDMSRLIPVIKALTGI